MNIYLHSWQDVTHHTHLRHLIITFDCNQENWLAAYPVLFSPNVTHFLCTNLLNTWFILLLRRTLCMCSISEKYLLSTLLLKWWFHFLKKILQWREMSVCCTNHDNLKKKKKKFSKIKFKKSSLCLISFNIPQHPLRKHETKKMKKTSIITN